MTKILISEKQIVGIYSFMENYVGVSYDKTDKLTHHVMNLFLEEKDIYLKRVKFSNAHKEDLLTGKYIVVRDENHQNLIYYNPRKSLVTLLTELRTFENMKKVELVRREILNELGYVESVHGLVHKNDLDVENYPLEHPNRNKVKEKLYKKEGIL